MYKLSVPFMLSQVERYGADTFISELRKIDADIVFLALGSYETDEEKSNAVFDSLKKYVPVFKKAGFTVGVWVWSFMIVNDQKYTHITSPNGAVSKNQVCPSDENFCKFAAEYIKNIAMSKPDMIMYDDDYRYGFIDCGLGCACKNHRAYMSEILGEDLSDKDLGKLIFGGKANKYRSAYLKANGHFLREFAKTARAAVDDVDPDIRLGLCACMSTWDFDGVSAAELSRILAGNTKPFLRLIGAPYWAPSIAWGNRLQDVIELERMESSWCGEGIEIFAEGDTYPRPRFRCPANMLEGFDMALRASGSLNGIHKYTFDYYADPAYEKGYDIKHIKNGKIYRNIEKYFSDKTPVGVRVYEYINKFENMTVPPYYDGKDEVQNTFFSPAARLMAAQTIPTIYEGLGTVGVAFGENAKYLDDAALSNGLIIDLPAAVNLMERGIDVGLKEVGGDIAVSEEYFPNENRYVGLFGCPAKEMTVKDEIKTDSFFISEDKRYIGSYFYENKDGRKFLVFAFDGYNAGNHAFKQYARGEQIERFIRFTGKRLPASMRGNPDCYMLCKENANGIAVWIGNFFADECLNTAVVLDGEFKDVKFINCNGKLSGNKVVIDDIAPFASVGFIAEK